MEGIVARGASYKGRIGAAGLPFCSQILPRVVLPVIEGVMKKAARLWISAMDRSSQRGEAGSHGGNRSGRSGQAGCMCSLVRLLSAPYVHKVGSGHSDSLD